MDTRKLEKTNKHLQRVMAQIIHKEADVPADVLVTVARVAATHNLASAEVFLYIYPTARAEEVVTHLRSQLYDIQGALNRALDARAVPRIRFTVDYGADHADTIEERLAELARDDESSAGTKT